MLTGIRGYGRGRAGIAGLSSCCPACALGDVAAEGAATPWYRRPAVLALALGLAAFFGVGTVVAYRAERRQRKRRRMTRRYKVMETTAQPTVSLPVESMDEVVARRLR